MSGKKKANEDLNDKIAKAAKDSEATPLDADDSGYDTVRYNPPPAPAPAAPVLTLADGPQQLNPGFTQMMSPQDLQQYFAASRQRNATYDNWMATIESNRLAKQATAPAGIQVYARKLKDGNVGFFGRTVPPKSALELHLVEKAAEAKAKIDAMLPELTEKQKEYILKRWQRITHRMKGKKSGSPKAPTQAQVNKVLYLCMEYQAKRRRAKLSADIAKARAERHAMQNHKRVVYTPSGEKLNFNVRAAKKKAADFYRRDAMNQVTPQIRATLANVTANQKANRLAIAQAFRRKANPKDMK